MFKKIQGFKKRKGRFLKPGTCLLHNQTYKSMYLTLKILE